MVLVIDVGNTRVKCAVFKDSTILNHYFFLNQNFIINIRKIFNNYPEIKNIILSAVGNFDNNDLLELKRIANTIIINAKTAFPFENLYATPTTLGIDRMVLASGAVYQFPQINRLVIDAGTCVTYDYINDKDEYLGGAISPGLRLRYESLHNYTSKLPLLALEYPDKFVGNSTNQSIHSGVVNGLLNEIEGFINKFEQENSNFIIILTGGDADFLAKRLKNTIFANSNFLLESLNLIYQHTNQNV